VSNFISLEKAIEMTTLYRSQMDTILADEYKGQDILVKSEVYARQQIYKLLAKPGCSQLRLYYGMDQDLKVHTLLVGVNERGEDMIGISPEGENYASEDIIEEAERCPPSCPPSSPLNS